VGSVAHRHRFAAGTFSGGEGKRRRAPDAEPDEPEDTRFDVFQFFFVGIQRQRVGVRQPRGGGNSSGAPDVDDRDNPQEPR